MYRNQQIFEVICATIRDKFKRSPDTYEQGSRVECFLRTA
jgi:hypothetical protein